MNHEITRARQMVELKADGSAGARKRSSPSISTTRVADGDGNDVEIVGWRGVGLISYTARFLRRGTAVT